MALHHSESILQPDMSCAEIGLPNLDPVEQPERELEFDAILEADEAANGLVQLNEEQAELVDGVLQDLRAMQNGEAPKCWAYFLKGPGGSGKTMC